MPIFISYSHQDKKFVDKLAANLVANKVSIWLDRWELHVGDSLIDKIQEAITDSSALLVILTNSSTKSEWCKKELNSGLIKELEERRVVILPVLMENCDIPLFLREKMYADFRHDFDEGLQTILESVSKLTNEWQARTDTPEWHTDWAIDWRGIDGDTILRLTMVEQAKGQPYTVLTTVQILCNPIATEIYTQYDKEGKGGFARKRIFGLLAENIKNGKDLNMLLKDQFEKFVNIVLEGPESNEAYTVKVACRRLGEDTGRDILMRVGDVICQAYERMESIQRQTK